jgi:hypothetical protein
MGKFVDDVVRKSLARKVLAIKFMAYWALSAFRWDFLAAMEFFKRLEKEPANMTAAKEKIATAISVSIKEKPFFVFLFFVFIVNAK